MPGSGHSPDLAGRTHGALTVTTTNVVLALVIFGGLLGSTSWARLGAPGRRAAMLAHQAADRSQAQPGAPNTLADAVVTLGADETEIDAPAMNRLYLGSGLVEAAFERAVEFGDVAVHVPACRP